MSKNTITVLIYYGHKLLDRICVYHTSKNYMEEANFLIYKPVLMTGNVAASTGAKDIDFLLHVWVMTKFWIYLTIALSINTHSAMKC
jgi:hypothetical protein